MAPGRQAFFVGASQGLRESAPAPFPTLWKLGLGLPWVFQAFRVSAGGSCVFDLNLVSRWRDPNNPSQNSINRKPVSYCQECNQNSWEPHCDGSAIWRKPLPERNHKCNSTPNWSGLQGLVGCRERGAAGPQDRVVGPPTGIWAQGAGHSGSWAVQLQPT